MQKEFEFVGSLGDLILDPARMFAEVPMDDWARVLDVNLTGTYLAMRAAVAPMRARGGGSIVTIASVAAKQPEAGPVAYSVSKAGVWMLTKQGARARSRASGIRVNAVGPGFIDTNMTKIVREVGVFDATLASIPMQRMGTAREVANTILFLASDEAQLLHGRALAPRRRLLHGLNGRHLWSVCPSEGRWRRVRSPQLLRNASVERVLGGAR